MSIGVKNLSAKKGQYFLNISWRNISNIDRHRNNHSVKRSWQRLQGLCLVCPFVCLYCVLYVQSVLHVQSLLCVQCVLYTYESRKVRRSETYFCGLSWLDFHQFLVGSKFIVGTFFLDVGGNSRNYETAVLQSLKNRILNTVCPIDKEIIRYALSF